MRSLPRAPRFTARSTQPARFCRPPSWITCINERNSTYTTTRPVTADELIHTIHDLIAARFTRGTVLASPAESLDYLKTPQAGYEHEVFTCLFLDKRHRVIEFRRLFHGTIDGFFVYPREVVRTALLLNTAAVIFAHNHPSGVAEPSRADEVLTQRLQEALALIEVRVLDHIVVGGVETVSFAERGLL
jgi:DNA repair protein RadC